MCNESRFFICRHCGNLVGLIKDSEVPLSCCGENMKELVPNTVDASVEKHLPVVTSYGDKLLIEVGSVEHPMTAEHSIEWIYIKTAKGGQRQCLNPGEKPKAIFTLDGDKAEAVYAYCNLHGLWKTDIN